MRARSLLTWGSVIAIAIAAPMIASKVVSSLAKREWTDIQAEAKNARVPLELDEALKEYQPGPDTQNAAEGAKRYLRAVIKPSTNRYNEFIGGFKDELKAANTRIEEEMKKGHKANHARIRRAVNLFEPHLSNFQTEIEKPSWNMKRSWDQGLAMLIPDGAWLKQTSKVLLAKATVCWSTNPADSLRAIQTVMRLGRHLESEPHTILVMVSVSLRAMAYRDALNLAILPGTTDLQRKQLAEVVADPATHINWRLMWRLEVLAPMSALYMVTSKEGFYELGLKTDDVPMRSERAMYHAKAAMAKLFIESEAALNAAPFSLEHMRKVADRYYVEIQNILADFHDVFAKLSSGENSFGFAVSSVQKLESVRRLTHLALQMTGDLRTPKLPADAKNPEWFDPFSGKPFQLKRSKGGFLLYSVGLNRLDDGGSSKEDINGERLDIVVNVTSSKVTVQ